ncbi:MAG: glycosyltransferase family 4 protein [Candidatus Aenigmarchaeota archaeon]|nr:glycosyltransferase family 4 protein [Candidatus Aenigmarchaeota archaeon]
MKICMITSYPPDKCGVSDYSERLAGELRKSGNDVMIISREGAGLQHERGIVRLIATKKVKRSLGQVLEEFGGLSRAHKDSKEAVGAIKRFNPDVVHVQYEPGLYNLFFLPMLLSKLKKLRIKSVVTLHGIDYFPLSIFHKIILYGKPDKIIVHTKHHYDMLEQEISRKSAKKMEIIPMGLIKEKRGKEGNYMLFFGFLNQHKGVEELLQAFANSGTDKKLVLIGSINPAYRPDVEYKNKIEKLIESLDIVKRVEFVYNFVPFKKLENYIKNSMFVVFPYRSSYSGGQSQAIIDSIAFGKPLIATKPAQGNLVGGKNAIIVNPDSVEELARAIGALSKSGGLRRKLSRNNRKLAARLLWSNIAKTTEEMYRELLS